MHKECRELWDLNTRIEKKKQQEKQDKEKSGVKDAVRGIYLHGDTTTERRRELGKHFRLKGSNLTVHKVKASTAASFDRYCPDIKVRYNGSSRWLPGSEKPYAKPLEVIIEPKRIARTDEQWAAVLSEHAMAQDIAGILRAGRDILRVANGANSDNPGSAASLIDIPGIFTTALFQLIVSIYREKADAQACLGSLLLLMKGDRELTAKEKLDKFTACSSQGPWKSDLVAWDRSQTLPDGTTTLMAVAVAGACPVTTKYLVPALIAVHCDVNARDQQRGATALYMAVEAELQQTVSLLLEHSADPSLAIHTGTRPTPLHLAISQHNADLLYTVLSCMEQRQRLKLFDVVDGRGQTVLQLAERKALDDCVKVLRAHGAEHRSERLLAHSASPKLQTTAQATRQMAGSPSLVLTTDLARRRCLETWIGPPPKPEGKRMSERHDVDIRGRLRYLPEGESVSLDAQELPAKKMKFILKRQQPITGLMFRAHLAMIFDAFIPDYHVTHPRTCADVADHEPVPQEVDIYVYPSSTGHVKCRRPHCGGRN